MRARIAASVVLAASVLLSTAGCAFFAPQATLKKYDPSDGVGGSVGDVQVRNALLLTKNGQRASFLVNLINEGEKTVSVRIQYDGTSATGTPGKVNTKIQLDAGEVKTFGSSSTRQLIFNGIDTEPGGIFPVFVQYGTKTGTELMVPVLNGALPEYSNLLPSPKPTQTVKPVSPTIPPTIVPAPTATPTN